jgi:formiminotetrahydrofolate cyclodeaminase
VLEQSLSGFLAQLGSAAPTPGGGSVAALTGAQAAGLVAMVCHLTIGKKRYAEHEDELRRVLAAAEDLQEALTKLIEADILAYDELMASYRLPKEDPRRAAAIQAALVPAAGIPLQIAEAAAAVFDLVPTVIAKGSTLAVSDAGMAALLAAAAIRSGALNVLINLHAMEHPERAADYRRRLDAAVADRPQRAEALYQEVAARLGG